jgi:alkanesulfonate monooxygenase SsuD/methylene tetrahydromethanopterin reductase-like flavin-dependent oxidoreductase (luciferase family)
MKFSLFFEMQIADPTRSSEARLFHQCVEQAVLADALGYHGIWAVEHHGLFEYSHCAAPETFLAFVAARTKRIRIGHGVTLLPYRYNHPIRIAERVATLDVLSEGRVNWGTGKSATRVEQGAFEIDRSSFHEEWREAIEMVPRMWRDEVFAWKGRFFDVPPTHVLPKPLQQPHPPIFAACSKPELAPAVGELGLGALNVAVYEDELLAQKVRAYRAAAENPDPVGDYAISHFACNPAALILDDDREACRHGLRGSQFFLRGLVHYFASQERPLGPIRAPREFPDERFLNEFVKHRNTHRSHLSSVIGDPVAAGESVQRFADVGVDELILVMQMGTVPHEIVMRSIRTFGEKVLPRFATDGPPVRIVDGRRPRAKVRS